MKYKDNEHSSERSQRFAVGDIIVRLPTHYKEVQHLIPKTCTISEIVEDSHCLIKESKHEKQQYALCYFRLATKLERALL